MDCQILLGRNGNIGWRVADGRVTYALIYLNCMEGCVYVTLCPCVSACLFVCVFVCVYIHMHAWVGVIYIRTYVSAFKAIQYAYLLIQILLGG